MALLIAPASQRASQLVARAVCNTSVRQPYLLLTAGLSGSTVTAEYSFKSSAFFGGKMNVRSSVVRVAQGGGRSDASETSSSAATVGRQPAAAAPRRPTLIEHYATKSTRRVASASHPSLLPARAP